MSEVLSGTTTGRAQRARLPRTSARTIALACAIAGAGALAAAGIGLAAGDDDVERWRLAARYSARFAFGLFLPVYAASSWHRLAPSALSRLVLARRRALGLAFATAHSVHLAALTTVLRTTGAAPDVAAIVGGGGAYLATFVLAATSNDAAVRALGRRWRTLHRIGVHWIWFVFAFSYSGRVARGDLFYAPLLALALGALGLRAAAWWSRRRARSEGRS